jgi:hypothetical protein
MLGVAIRFIFLSAVILSVVPSLAVS